MQISEFAFEEGIIYTFIGFSTLEITMMMVKMRVMKKVDPKKCFAFASLSNVLILDISKMATRLEAIAILLLLIGMITMKSYILIIISHIIINTIEVIVWITLYRYRKNRENSKN